MTGPLLGSRWPVAQGSYAHCNREIVLGRVAALVKRFVKRISMERGLSEAAANAAGGKIFTFGSYRLGVHGPGADIDTLCVVPKHVSREDFFETFEPMLKELEGATEVSVSSFSTSLFTFISELLSGRS
jgi:poly(A) polymerase Pap1